MNIRLAPGSLRLRISTEEFERLEREGSLVEPIFLSGPATLTFEVRVLHSAAKTGPAGGPDLRVRAQPGRIIAEVSSEALQRLRIPSKSGIVTDQEEAGQSLRCALEVDLREACAGKPH